MMGRTLLFSLSFFLSAVVSAQDVLPLDRIILPTGFSIELLARVPNARAMVLGEGPVLYVGSMSAGTVTALELDGQFRLKSSHVIARGLRMPVGLTMHKGSLYVSAVNRILKFEDIRHHLERPPAPRVIRDDLPAEGHHGGRFIGFGPDGRLYVSIGAPCNVCEADPRRYGHIRRMDPDGGREEVFAAGVRDSVGFDWNPRTGSLWFTDNGRDWLGDDLPPDELNRASKSGLHFGFPYCHGGTLAEPQFGNKRNCTEFEAPALNLGAHVAAIGMRFYRGEQFPAAYRDAIFVAEHGSWNRSRKSGYRVAVVKVQGDRTVSHEVFAAGWLQGETAWGRPADVLPLPDGSLLVSDDLAGAIYRIRYAAR